MSTADDQCKHDQTEEDAGDIIIMSQEQELAWNSDEDSASSCYSTPGYKRGHHTEISQHQIISMIISEHSAHSPQEGTVIINDSRFTSPGLARE